MAQDIVSIIAGGWSASQVDLARLPGLIVGVNNSAFYAPHVDIALSMDRRWTEFRWPWIKDRAETGELQAWIRRSAAKNIPQPYPWLHIFENDYRTAQFSEDRIVLNGTNSGGCALAYAYMRRPKTVYLFGFDLRPGPKGEGHWYGKGEPLGIAEVGSAPIHATRYSGWAREYTVCAGQFQAAGIDVVNVSDRSLITAFRRMSPKDFRKACAA